MRDDKVTSGFKFGTKAETLNQLFGELRYGRTCDQVTVTEGEWHVDALVAVTRVLTQLPTAPRLIVRSSAVGEDSATHSKAGKYSSIGGVQPVQDKLLRAIDEVFASYDIRNPSNQVLVQEELTDIAVSGVITTKDLDTGGPYYVLNYDDFSGRTNTVTSGSVSKVIFVHRSMLNSLHSNRFRKLLSCVQEIEVLTGCDELDLEFCITRDEEVFILQVRPLTTQENWFAPPADAMDAAIRSAGTAFSKASQPVPGIAGKSTVLTVMSDWNPAEMIGVCPRPLAMSLYKMLITDRIWAEARMEMGYRVMPDHPLLIDLHGRPYIDVRLSLNSFLPASLGDDSAHSIVDSQLARLRAHPESHDKLEFDVAATCYDFNFDVATNRLREDGVPAAAVEELRDGLYQLTKHHLEAGSAAVEAVLARTSIMLDDTGSRSLAAVARNAVTAGSAPFSIAARHGFIAVALIRSLVACGVVGEDFKDRFISTVHTEANSLMIDTQAMLRGSLEKSEFLARYGHLRPGTYDIMSLRYDERPDLFDHQNDSASVTVSAMGHVTAAEMQAIDAVLSAERVNCDAEHLLAYCRTAIAARETAKFRYTRPLSDLISMIAMAGEVAGFSRDDLSYLTFEEVNSGFGNPDTLRRTIMDRRQGFLMTRAIRLPYLIGEADDIEVVRVPMQQPNFITGKSVLAPCVRIDADFDQSIDGCLVMIESADPGFDWIFTHPIAGLITKYGGVNSHMAIRCAEFGLPAAIGCGERLFETIVGARLVDLNCTTRTLKAVR